MGPTLTITSDKAGYTLSDRATYLASQKNIALNILFENKTEPGLLNVYHVIQVNPAKFPDLGINAEGAKAFDDFMISPDTQKLIGQFGIAQYGQQLFFPDYGKTEAQVGLPEVTPSTGQPVSSPSISANSTAAATTLPTASPTKQPYLTAAPPRTPGANKEIILSTTTSTRDSGLLDVLIPIFQKQTGYTVKTVAVGTGAALALGRQGNADVILAHDYVNEISFMNDGFGINRQLVMHNDFIVVGPASDPANVKSAVNAVDAFKKIAAASATFVSRGDASGTNAQELRIWKAAGITVAKS